MFFLRKKKKVDMELLRKKAIDNDKNAQYELGLAYYRGTEVKKDVEKANYWLGRANEK